MQDRTLSCVECGKEFVFTVAEQTFFREHGLTHEPKRCGACRRGRKGRRRAVRPEADRHLPGVRVRRMRGPAPGEAAGPGEPPRRPKPSREMHPSVCTLCGEETQVPFVPDGVRPVYCLSCLKKQTR